MSSKESKLHPRLSKPLKVVENRGHDTYCLSDGARWHADRLVSVPATTTADGVEENDELPGEERTTRSTGSEATEGGRTAFCKTIKITKCPNMA